MADALTIRGLQVIQMEQLPEVLPTVDPALGHLAHAQLADRGLLPADYPGSHRITMRFTGDRATGQLLGAQLSGTGTPSSPSASTSPPPPSSTP